MCNNTTFKSSLLNCKSSQTIYFQGMAVTVLFEITFWNYISEDVNFNSRVLIPSSNQEQLLSLLSCWWGFIPNQPFSFCSKASLLPYSPKLIFSLNLSGPRNVHNRPTIMRNQIPQRYFQDHEIHCLIFEPAPSAEGASCVGITSLSSSLAIFERLEYFNQSYKSILKAFIRFIHQ